MQLVLVRVPDHIDTPITEVITALEMAGLGPTNSGIFVDNLNWMLDDAISRARATVGFVDVLVGLKKALNEEVIDVVQKEGSPDV